jgi:hypothetical protein
METGAMFPWMATHIQEILICIARGIDESEIVRETGHG